MPDLKNRFLTFLLRTFGKDYQPDPAIPASFILQLMVRRLVWLLRGWIRFQKPVFVGKAVMLEGKGNLYIGHYSTLDPHVWVNAVSREPVRIGRYTRIGAGSKIMCTAHLSKVGQHFSMGDHSGCGEFCFFGAAGGITIGQRVIMGQYVSMHAQDHLFNDTTKPIQDQGTVEKGIIIGDDCWIGAKATILDGTTIGRHCVIAAGAVVKGDFPDYAVIGGVPAKIIRMIDNVE